ncbi:CaiB/BaiF CoA transferase family protein [Amycolatopsis regifaucium]|uniref:Carnitine dehydratase n=1 Tax=Amycolatopsis regifaucium TaxID=546365 RepID=A0A154MNC9_9PSEU|nr:CoA transferase [Amycolatopsis regifaucium]KZB85357.1 carnitine dehydratase [Amycolatopsis regifaucium]OKA09035.1 carnitine dehydratase [Amycolatopsis regifaucium]SFJ40040.1 Crotonobetainyl-CoA:carnitine CoA-transferase CaiB [Amycolatopsis regifaucium]
MPDTALGPLRVLDFSRVLAGPFATMLLADFGAKVVKVERPGTGDDTRSWGPPYDAAGQATYFQSVNRNKTSAALDLGDPADLAKARALALAADVVVENFRPGVMDRLGLGPDALRAANPRLVYCSITGFGSGGGAALPGYDLLIQAVGGLMSITGDPDGEPQKAGVALVDVLAGLFASVGILAALRHRDRTGEGQRVEIDLLSSLLAALVNQGSAYTSGGTVPARMGNRHPSIAPYELLPCADHEIALAVGNDRQFATLCEVIGLPELAGQVRFATNPARVEHRAELRTLLVEHLSRRTAAEWAAELSAAGVPAGEVNDVAGAFALAERLGLNPTVDLPRPDGTSVRLTRNPIGLSATPPRYETAPPEDPGQLTLPLPGWD